ncbi:MAG: virulence RhuM family protein [Methanoregula sp.]|nr:virulence RhuM family protein [Methanoregula sp.]
MEPVARSQILFYQSEDGSSRIEVRREKGTVWLTQALIAELYQTSKQNVSFHIRNIFDDRELAERSVVKEYLTTAADGKNYNTKFYNLDMILAIGYRVRSHRGTQF